MAAATPARTGDESVPAVNGPLIPFLGAQGRATMNLQDVLQPWALFGKLAVAAIIRFSRYDALMIQMNHRFSKGLQLNAHYTGRKPRISHNRSSIQRIHGYGRVSHFKPGLSELSEQQEALAHGCPHRFVVSYLYELPVGKGRPIHPGNRLVAALAGGWKTAGAFTAQSGYRFSSVAPTTAQLTTARPRRRRAPRSPQGIAALYDGATRVTLHPAHYPA